MQETKVKMMSDEKHDASIPFYAVESMLDRQGLTIKRLWIICILLIVLLVGTNALWIWYESQWQDEVITQEIQQDSGEGGMNTYSGKIIGGDYNGEADDQDNGAQ